MPIAYRERLSTALNIAGAMTLPLGHFLSAGWRPLAAGGAMIAVAYVIDPRASPWFRRGRGGQG